MLDYFGIFTRGGALLWTLQFTALRHNPVEALSALVRSCLLEERLSDTAFTYTPKQGAAQTLKWTFHNGLGLVFVAVYQKTLSLLYVEELLQLVKAEFASEYKPHVYSYRKFDDTFKRLLSEAEQRAEAAKRPTLTMRSGASNAAAAAAKAAAKKGGQQGTGVVGGQQSSAPSGGSEEDGAEDDGLASREASRGRAGDGHRPSSGVNTDSAFSDRSTGQDDTDTNNESDGGVVNKSAFDVSKLPKGARLGARPGIPTGPRRRGSTAPAASNGKDDVKGAKADAPKKKLRNWNVLGKNEGAPAKLDYTDYGGGANGQEQPTLGAGDGLSRMDRDDDDEDVPELEDIVEPSAQGSPGGQGAAAAAGGGGDKKKGLLASFMSSLALRVVGSAALSLADLEPALGDMKRKLMERNVAEEIAQQICDSVGKRLEGQKLSSFTGVSSFVSSAFEESLEGILNKRQVDVLMDIQRSQARQKPYVIVFCGVNGVGKSTNLAKIAYWLLQHNIKVTIAACDTFRAGAVEQLKTHCARLGVPLYERGYEKDPAKVAAEAIRQAERDGNHVVLVDTAGRMQDNEPLMRALSTLINVNEPNLVLFVGEALVGNDAVDQLSKFNRALADLAPPGCTRKRLVDGIVLTKFDTIDDKVGAALSMVYTAGAPVMFVGCGQTYVDLKKLNIKSVVRSLLK